MALAGCFSLSSVPNSSQQFLLQRLANGVVLFGVCFFIFVCRSQAESNGESRLLRAVQDGDKREIRSLVNRANVNFAAGDGSTVLAWATHKDDTEAVEILIRAGADVNAANDNGITPLALACLNKNTAIIGKLLKAGAAPNATQRTGETPFMTCVRTGDQAAVRLLLAHGADVNTRDKWAGQTPLMWAAGNKHPGVLRLLIERRADVNARSNGAFTALMFASSKAISSRYKLYCPPVHRSTVLHRKTG
jgi:uncharacterized protein